MILKTKIYLACGREDLRPVMQFIYFKEGFAYATDAHILVKQHLGYCFEATAEEVLMLEGMFIDAAAYKLLFNRHIAISQKVEEGKPKRVFIQTMYGRLKLTIELQNSEVAGRFPDCERVIPKGDDPCIATDKVYFNTKIFMQALQCVYHEESLGTFCLKAIGESKAVKIVSDSVSEDKQTVIVMPAIPNKFLSSN